MNTKIFEIWEQFTHILKTYGNTLSILNPPCSGKQIDKFETKYRIEFPHELRDLLNINDGQRTDEEEIKKGIFKSISGWDVYRRHIFLGIEEIEIAYSTFLKDEVLLTEFGINQIPFAIAGRPDKYKEAFCINSATNAISLIWTDYIDPFNPPEWQVAKFLRSKSLISFIKRQMEFYR